MELLPGVCLDVILIEIVLPIHTIIASEHVDIVLESHASMQRPLYRKELLDHTTSFFLLGKALVLDSATQRSGRKGLLHSLNLLS